MQNLISITVDTQLEKAIIEKINELKAMLPQGLITLTDAEKSVLPKMGDKSLGFVEKCLDAATSNPAVCPSFVDLEESRKDLDMFMFLNRVQRALAQVNGPINDSATLAGSEAYAASLSVYNLSKDAARRGVPGAKSIYADLSNRFPGRSKAVKE